MIINVRRYDEETGEVVFAGTLTVGGVGYGSASVSNVATSSSSYTYGRERKTFSSDNIQVSMYDSIKVSATGYRGTLGTLSSKPGVSTFMSRLKSACSFTGTGTGVIRIPIYNVVFTAGNTTRWVNSPYNFGGIRYIYFYILNGTLQNVYIATSSAYTFSDIVSGITDDITLPTPSGYVLVVSKTTTTTALTAHICWYSTTTPGITILLPET